MVRNALTLVSNLSQLGQETGIKQVSDNHNKGLPNLPFITSCKPEEPLRIFDQYLRNVFYRNIVLQTTSA